MNFQKHVDMIRPLKAILRTWVVAGVAIGFLFVSISFAKVISVVNVSDSVYAIYFYDINRQWLEELMGKYPEGRDVRFLGAMVIKKMEDRIEVEGHIDDGLMLPNYMESYETLYGKDQPEERRNDAVKNVMMLGTKKAKKPIIELRLSDNKLNGVTKIRYSRIFTDVDAWRAKTENFMVEIPFVDNVANGKMIVYSIVDSKENAREKEFKIRSESELTQGLFEGDYVEYDADGNVVLRARKKNGAIDGNSNQYFYRMEHSYSGSAYKLAKQIVTPYELGKINGDQTEYIFKAGSEEVKEKKVSSYKNGSLVSISTYNPQDRIVEKTVYEGEEKLITYKYDADGKVAESINHKEIKASMAKRKEEERRKFERIQSKLSEIEAYYTYNHIVAMLGKPDYAPSLDDGISNTIEIVGDGYAKWYFPGYQVGIGFRHRFVKEIYINDHVFRIFR